MRATTRERLARMLADAGFPTKAPLIGIQGWERVRAKYDDTTVTWEGWVDWERDPAKYRPLHIVSYSTMTECVRRGFTTREDAGLLWVESKP